MNDLQKPYAESFCDVGQGHKLYVACFGNPDGIPAVCLHGGPGMEHSPLWQKYFDLEKYNVVMFDQRGCGKSTPLYETKDNTISNLVEDIAKIRSHLGIKEKWVVCSGSWGSALALFYVEKYFRHIRHLALRGMFLATKKEAAYIGEENGAEPFLPGYFESYRDFIPTEKRVGGLIAAYDDVMKHGDESQKQEASKRFMDWDVSISCYREEDVMRAMASINQLPSLQRSVTALFMHYACHEFSDDHWNRLLRVPELKDIPMDIIHGRQDRICKVETAMALHQAYPHSRLYICEETGHSGMEPEIFRKYSEVMNGISPV